MAKVTGVLLYISIITPIFLFALVPITACYIIAQRYYIKTSRELSRLDSTSRSPIYALFSETLDGLTTIRAFNCEKIFLEKIYKSLDNNQAAYYLNFSANGWLAVRLELAGTMIITFAALSAVLARESILRSTSSDITQSQVSSSEGSNQQTQLEALAGLAGLAISLALSVTQSLNWSVRMASDLEVLTA
jgi:ATP-binding cassette subfamily C (CFTR/MRP) protein 1